MKNIFFIYMVTLLFSVAAFAQENTEQNTEKKAAAATPKVSMQSQTYKLDALAPSRAAFYSAVLPGLGQIHNKKYWKAPIVWGGLGISIYSYTWNQTKYHEYRDAYKDVLAGKPLTGRLEGLDADRLIRAQKYHQRNRDLSALVTAGIYILNILDANVDAHLKQFNVNENLSLSPGMQQNQIDNQYSMGLTLSYKF